ncbi:hypothetical protein GCM10010174_84750 [Kutzneria viridogrisea]|uniref:Uncharacterized protein n=1 Tax=Kutzneria viridogrisea TaxID=47990 RepID=A0ABR6BBZ0_9PSEU|nr:hypothetical protein [Kutzneria viridogrisea]
MPNKTSLIRRLAELRSSYTGETDSSVLPAISQGGQLLDPDERAQLLSTLAHNWVTRALGENSLPPLPARIRQAVLPDATTRDQRELESGILAAAGRAVNYLHLRRPADLLRPARVFRMVRSLPGDLVLHIEPPALAPLMLELMPRITADDVLGLPGLRARLHRRHVELYLVDTDPPATVLISNVSYRQWLAAMAFLDAELAGERASCWTCSPEPLTPQESHAVGEGRRDVVGIEVLSALLRRIRLTGDTLWSSVRVEDGRIHVDWAGGATTPTVAAGLIHPLFGLPGDEFDISRENDGINVRDHGTGVVLRINRTSAPVASALLDVATVDRRWEAHEQELAKHALPAFAVIHGAPAQRQSVPVKESEPCS